MNQDEENNQMHENSSAKNSDDWEDANVSELQQSDMQETDFQTYQELPLGSEMSLNISESKRLKIVNPYMQLGVKNKSLLTPSQAAKLPDGKHAIALGSGVIAGILGEGGMARVYRVWNQKLELYRAVKVVYPTDSTELMERFETEIKISAKLHHPNIIETYVVGDWNGLPYIEMELVDGVSLETLIQMYGRLPQEVCAAIGIRVASALAYAHTEKFLIYGKEYNGIIHRDLKPANIMIGKNGVVKLMDFGIARPSEVHLHTVSGYIIGTLPYLAPEQLAETEIDHRSDIYSLGTILYEALTGEKTFPQQNVATLMRMKVQHTFKKFDSFALEIDLQLKKLVEKCLRHDKKRRFDTSSALQESLREIYRNICGDPIETVLKNYIESPVNFRSKTTKIKTQSDNKKPIITGISLIAILTVIIGLFFVLSPHKKHKKDTNTAPAIVLNKKDTVIAADTTPDTIQDSVPATSRQDSSSVVSKKKVVKAKQKLLPEQKDKLSKAAVPQKIQTSSELLVKKYNKTDFAEIADAAFRSNDWNDVITAVSSIPEDNANYTNGKLLMAYAYVELGNVKKSAQILESFSSDDALYLLIEGRIALTSGMDKKALDKFESAMVHPGKIRSSQSIRNDALYYMALIYDNRYTSTRSPEAREQALIAWTALKKAYVSQPEHPRFKFANQKLSAF